MRQARIVPSQRDGRTVGFKMLGVRRGSLPAAVGIENGDLIMKVNGEALHGLDSGMKALVGFRAGGEFRLDIERRGKAMTQILNVKIEPAN